MEPIGRIEPRLREAPPVERIPPEVQERRERDEQQQRRRRDEEREEALEQTDEDGEGHIDVLA
jgi:hypothetical protein